MKHLIVFAVASLMGAFAVFGNDIAPVAGQLEKARMEMEARRAPLLAQEWRAHSLTSADIGAVTGVVYSGTAKTPTPTVKLNGKALTAGTDFDFTYTNNTAAGYGLLTVTAKRFPLYGAQCQKFRISPIQLVASNITVPAQSYDGYPKKPTPTVKVGATTLNNGRDFAIVGYDDNLNKGSNATITVKGIGNYGGTVKQTFVIQ